MTDNTIRPPINEWANGWPIVLSALVGIALCLSPLPYWALIVIGPELIKEFGWSRAITSSGFLYMTAGVLVSAPIVGQLVDKLGARRILLPSIVALSLGTMSFAFITSDPKIFFLVFYVTAVLGTGTLPITWTKAIVSRFDKHRGLALGLALTGTGLFGFIASPTIQLMIDNFGWRMAYIGVGLLPLIFSLPLAFFLFRDSEIDTPIVNRKEVINLCSLWLALATVLFLSMGSVSVKYGPLAVIFLMAIFLLGYIIYAYINGVRTNKSDISFTGFTLREAMKDYRFWVIFSSFLLLGGVVSGIIANSKFILLDKGYTDSQATGFFTGAGLIGLSTIIGRFFGGWLVDHFWAPMIAFIFMSIPAIGCYILMKDYGVGTNALALILVGLAAGVEFDLMAYFISRYFGMKSYSQIYGIIYAAFGLGAGTSPIVFNLIRGDDADYANVLKIVSIGFVIGALLLLTLGRYRKFDSNAPG